MSKLIKWGSCTSVFLKWNSVLITSLRGNICRVIGPLWWESIGHRCIPVLWCIIKTLRSGQNGRHFPYDIFKCIFLNENVWIPIKISLQFVPKGPINNIPALVQIMAWRRSGDKPLSEPMMVSLLAHFCVTRPQWVNVSLNKLLNKHSSGRWSEAPCRLCDTSVMIDNSIIFCIDDRALQEKEQVLQISQKQHKNRIMFFLAFCCYGYQKMIKCRWNKMNILVYVHLPLSVNHLAGTTFPSL